MGKNKYAPKLASKPKIEEEEKPLKPLRGCPCPGMKGCIHGHPVMADEDSFILICSALSCPYAEVPTHKSCFEKYEDQLLRTLGDKGSARGWTPYKARRNLWKNNGQGLIAMCCRCICQKGNIRPPEEIVLAERILVAPIDVEKKRKPKKKDLPIINMNGGANPKQARMQSRFEKEEMEDDLKGGRGILKELHTPPYTPRRTRTSSVTSFSSQSIISTTSSMVRTDEHSPLTPHGDLEKSRNRRDGRRGRMGSRARADSGVSVRTPPLSPMKPSFFFPSTISPVPLVKSYAATIKSEESSKESSTISHSVGKPLLKLPDAWFTQSTPAWEIVSFGLYADEKKNQGGKMREEKVMDIWTPWNGFNIGPLSICGVSIPSLPKKK